MSKTFVRMCAMALVLVGGTSAAMAESVFTEDWSAYEDYDWVVASGKGNWQMLTAGYDIRLRSWPHGIRTTYGLEGHFGNDPGYVNEIIHPVTASDEFSTLYELDFRSFAATNRNFGTNGVHTKHSGMGLYDMTSGTVLVELYYDWMESGWMLDGRGLGGSLEAITGSVIDGENEIVDATIVVDLENSTFWAEYTSLHFPNRASSVQTITATEFTIDAVYLVESLGWSANPPSGWAQSCVGGAIHAIELSIESDPADCQQVQDMGHNLTGDLNGDCYVEWADFGIFAGNWQACNDPGVAGCTENW